MILIVELPDEDHDRVMTPVYARRLTEGATIQVQGYRATVIGTVEKRYEDLVPCFITGGAG